MKNLEMKLDEKDDMIYIYILINMNVWSVYTYIPLLIYVGSKI